MSPARGFTPSAGVIKEDIRIVTVSLVGYNYIAYDAPRWQCCVAKLDTTPGVPFIETPIIHGRWEAAGYFFFLQNSNIYYITL
jgi:hypothetical protein